MTATAEGRDVRLTVIPDGPVLARGAERVYDEDGCEHTVDRPVVALCACGRSSRMPWCDSTHKAVQRGKS